jgi:spermidine synthase
MNQFTRRILFFLFFLSGFSSLVYQVVWTRMAFASFGIITPVLSVVLSVFMLGLSVGAWGGGRAIGALVQKTGLSAILFYAGAELVIGLGAFAVPKLFAAGEHFLLTSGQTNSTNYLCLSALVLAASILPWCVFMGATFPLMMAYVRERDRQNAKSFSFLYLANVLGAMCGTFLSAVVLVEILGFRATLWVAAAGNLTVAFISGWLAWKQRGSSVVSSQETTPSAISVAAPQTPVFRWQLTQWILFSTGFCAMAMEVVWTRAFTPILKTQVYSFAMIVFFYLGATFLGSALYRRALRKNSLFSTAELISFLSIAAFLPVLATDPRLVTAKLDYVTGMYLTNFTSVVLVLASICPLCAVLGYLTPSLIDQHAAGRPAKAGKVYAVNILGCILGPLFASYILLPWVGERLALIILGLPFIIFFALYCNSLARSRRVILGLMIFAIAGWSLLFSKDFDGLISGLSKNTVIRRDYAASVISFGNGRKKQLLVNGVGMTSLTPITKFMVHLPMAFHEGRPESALIICFGMGTSFRSALSWNVDTTAVELVPSVAKAFGFYFADAAKILKNPKGHIVIDDGRRYLKRTRKKFDVIVVDPPPPVEAAGSSLLYSDEFYALAKQHLKTNGIIQIWFPGGERTIVFAVLRSLSDSFPYVRCFGSVEGWGAHLLASSAPIPDRTAEELAARMPARAQEDLLEWNSRTNLTISGYLNLVVSQEVPVQEVLNPDVKIRITDDHPYNEYFLLRRWCPFYNGD